MPNQLQIYSSSDAGGPGVLFGAASEVLRVLDLILVNGYTAHPAAGWTKPFANSGNIGCYKNASPANGGNGFGVVINDNGANVTSTFKEAWATGWETVLGVGSPVGTGTGQFPTPAQLLTTGHVVIRKSATADGTTGRAWICFADALTFYLFIASGDTAGAYFCLWFGDFFSLKGSTDTYRCMIQGEAIENNGSTNTSQHTADMIACNALSAASYLGCYASRTYGGGGTSVQLYKQGASQFDSPTANLHANVGTLQAPNGPDNAYYTPPIWILEQPTLTLRGRLRGLYHSAHTLATWSDGQVLTGAGDFAGKTLQAVSKGINSGMWFIETSATVETN